MPRPVLAGTHESIFMMGVMGLLCKTQNNLCCSVCRCRLPLHADHMPKPMFTFTAALRLTSPSLPRLCRRRVRKVSGSLRQVS